MVQTAVAFVSGDGNDLRLFTTGHPAATRKPTSKRGYCHVRTAFDARRFTLNRRVLFGLTAGALAAPAILPRLASAQDAAAPAAGAEPAPRIHSFPLGGFKVTVISDGKRVSEKPQETFGPIRRPKPSASS